MNKVFKITLQVFLCLIISLAVSPVKAGDSKGPALGWLNLLLDDSQDTDIPQDNWSIVYVSSEELVGEDSPGENAFDGDPNTIWHTKWKDSQPPHPHEIQIDLGATYQVNSFRYLPRQDGSTFGMIKDYEFYVSTSTDKWGNSVASGRFKESANEKTVELASPAVGRFIRLVALNEVRGRPYTSVAEINVKGTAYTGALHPSALIDTPTEDVTIDMEETVFFSGAATDPGNLALTYRWNFGDPAIPDRNVRNPSNIRFNNAGTFTVTFTATNSEGLSDSDTRLITVLDPNTPVQLPQNNWNLIYVSSAEDDSPGENAFDGDPNTIWHTEWRENKPEHPHEIQIDLGEVYELDGFRYLPRQDGFHHGRIKDYEFYVSNDTNNWGESVSSGTFADSATEKTVVFDSTAVGRYIRLVALNEVRGNHYTTVAEINVLGRPPLVSQDDWELVYVSSAENDTPGENSFDGDPNTIWHTEWRENQPGHPHEIQIDLGAAYELNRFHYLPRQDGLHHGRIKDYEFYVSNNSNKWENPVASGTFVDSATEKTVIFDSPAVGRYIRLVALNEVRGNDYTTVAEINVAGHAFSGVLSPTALIDTPTQDVTINIGESVFFSGTGTDPDNLALSYNWDFGDPTIPNATVEKPGNLQFNNAGTFTVTFTATNSEGLSDSDTRLITVVDPNAPARIPQGNWNLIYVSSEEDGLPGENAFDGDPNTIWHTEWKDSQPAHPHEIRIDLGATYELESFSHLPRQDGSDHGRIKDYEFYVSDNTTDWGSPVALGSFADSATEKTVVFDSTAVGQYIRLVALNEVDGRFYASVAEINVVGIAASTP